MRTMLQTGFPKAATFLKAAAVLVLGLAPMAPAPAPAQVASTELFRPVVTVNGKAITNYEVQQRLLMLRAFRTPGDLEKQAVEGLIDDRLRVIAAEQMDISITEEQIETGEAEFASRANLEREQFLEAIAGAGIARESFRDFVAAGLLWREVVRVRFSGRVQVTEAEVDRALSLSSRRGGAELLFSEIILPANTPAAAAQSERLAADISQNVRTEAAFSSYARQYSAAPSRNAGGRLPQAVPLGNLPPPIAQALLTLAPGEVTEPFPIPDAIALFQLRGIIETDAPELENVAVDYAQFFIGGGRSEQALHEAQRIRDRVDTCDDLYAVAKNLPAERLARETRPVAELPQDIALELARLDEGEVSTALTRGEALVFLMLCSRTAAPGEEGEVNRGAIRDRLSNQRAAAYANGYLAELKADAIIQYP